MTRHWHIAGRKLILGERTLIMGIMNVTPDSFSDGSRFVSRESAFKHAQSMIADGADLIDIGGESTRPGATPVSPQEELERVLPLVESLAGTTDKPISIDTTKSAVAQAALKAGAAIVNDISALRFDPELADTVATSGAGLILMHSRGAFTNLHTLPHVPDIVSEVTSSLTASVLQAQQSGVDRRSIVIDPGIGFGKSQEQNIELLAKLNSLREAFYDLPILVGTSRKSFLGRLLDDAPTDKRLYGTLATLTAAVLFGADIVRVHDVKAAVETCRIADTIRDASR